MKKLVAGLRLILCLILMGFFVIAPYDVYAKEAGTIKDLEVQLEELKQEKKDNQNAKSQTQSQINAKRQAVFDAYDEQEEIKVKVVEAEDEIVESNNKIEKTTAETNSILRFYQISNGENVYLEYISGADSTTDLIMRVAIIEQITKYNKELVDEMNTLIEENEQLKIELASRNEELIKKSAEYETAIKSLGNKLSALNEINEDINDQIKNQEALIDYYKTVCKSDTQLLSECAPLAYATGFIRPLVKGSITSSWGYRKDPITGKKNSFHNAIDIGGNKEGTPVYSAAAGMVAAVTKKSSCGGNIVYIHHNVKGKYYTTQYAHLLSYNVKVGDKVSANSQIGTVGGGKKTKSWDGCSTGAHLHFGISTGHYLSTGTQGYKSWSTFLARSVDPMGFIPPGKKWTKRF